MWLENRPVAPGTSLQPAADSAMESATPSEHLPQLHNVDSGYAGDVKGFAFVARHVFESADRKRAGKGVR